MYQKIKIISLCMLCVVCLLLAGCSSLYNLSSSDDKDNTFRLDTDNHNRVTSTTIVEALVSALNNPNRQETIYNALRSSFDGQVSLDEFSKYLNALSGNRKNYIHAFYRIDSSHKQELVSKIIAVNPAMTEMANNSTYYSLLTKDDKGHEVAGPTIAVQEENQRATISAEWLKAVSDIYDYSKIYFQALDQEDRASLEYLLRDSESSRSDSPKLKEIIATKVDRLLEYYRESVTHRPTQSKLILLLPYYAEYQRTSFLSNSEEHRYTSVKFTLADQRLIVEDPLREYLLPEHIVLYKDGEPELFASAGDIHQINNSGNLVGLLGSIKQIVSINADDKTGIVTSKSDTSEEKALDDIIYKTLIQKDGSGLFKVVYDSGIELSIKGYIDNAKKLWAGQIEEIMLTSESDYSFGGELSVGMSLVDFYQYYPFIRESGYRLTTDYAGVTLELALVIADDKISGLKLKVIE